MKVSVLNQKGEKAKDLQVSNIFDVELTPEALTLYVNYLRNALREPIAYTKDRSEVSGGGRKPWKQKGTGKARHGSNRSPLWVGGGVTFGPNNESNFKLKINKNLKKKVILGIIGKLINDKKAIFVESLAIESGKTKDASKILENIKADCKISVIFNNDDSNAHQSFRNLAGVHLSMPGKLDVLNLISSDNLVVSEGSLKQIEEIYTKKEKVVDEK